MTAPRPISSGTLVDVTSVGDETVRAFVPHPLPPDPPLAIDAELHGRLGQALVALGRLDGITSLLPSPELFIYGYVRKEAVFSSQIEGTQSSLSDLMIFEAHEAPGVPLNDVREVSNHVAATVLGISRLREGFPLCNRLLREVHAVLLAHGRGAEREPGEFRRSQNWIGGTRPGNATFVPPPSEHVERCMSDLERFVNGLPTQTPALIKAGLAHAQFETIHPFLDGNGRLGRLLITLILHEENVLNEPLLYLSLYLKKHRQEYFDLLQGVRLRSEWTRWLSFFATAVKVTAEEAVSTAKRILALFEKDTRHIQEHAGRAAGSALQVHVALQNRPIADIKHLSAATGLSVPTVGSALERLGKISITRELTGRKRDRLYEYREYVALLSGEDSLSGKRSGT